ncbi:MAG TPA: LysM peptidoglycan-binding domain-containing protein [Candidatus Saccharimonadales bacterium]|jgi:surface antigen|nr:LysM peptidoglycan-binding domain-containing protein [Candidatus Saccharimonadales bacterium]
MIRQWRLKFQRRLVRRRAVRLALIGSNLIILGGVLFFVLQGQPAASLATSSLANEGSVTAVANPLDQVSSADIALTVARLGSLPETTAISNQAQSAAADIAMTASTDNVVSKPEVVGTVLKSNADIQDYTTAAGDTVSSLANKFGVTSDSIRWSNSLSGDALTAGTKLAIPPVNGIVYTVKPGDTADTLASRFKSNRDKIIAYNDAEITGLQPGERIIVPDGVQAGPTTAANIAGIGTATTTSFPWGSAPIYGYNGYDYGYCTWYVATQVAVPANWGNASTWAYYASLSGWHVSKTPAPGAIAQIGGRVAGGEGHVAVVDAVLPDGSIQYRDMNGVAGWGRVGYGTVSAGFFDNYITH